LSSTYKTMDKVQNKPNSSVQHKPSSESFQVYLFIYSHKIILEFGSTFILRLPSVLEGDYTFEDKNLRI
jgi:hypothetical protein